MHATSAVPIWIHFGRNQPRRTWVIKLSSIVAAGAGRLLGSPYLARPVLDRPGLDTLSKKTGSTKALQARKRERSRAGSKAEEIFGGRTTELHFAQILEAFVPVEVPFSQKQASEKGSQAPWSSSGTLRVLFFVRPDCREVLISSSCVVSCFSKWRVLKVRERLAIWRAQVSDEIEQWDSIHRAQEWHHCARHDHRYAFLFVVTLAVFGSSICKECSRRCFWMQLMPLAGFLKFSMVA